MAGRATPRGGIIEGINVTPLVDITLVLLVIFIVTAKLVVTPAVPLDLPKAAHSQEVQTIFAVSITREGTLLVDGAACADAALQAKARAALARDRDLRVVIQADGAVPHRRVIEALDQIKLSGVEHIAFGALKPERPTSER